MTIKLKPHHWRRTTVFTLLDYCWDNNKTTRYEMQKYVLNKTGKSPSPKLIIKWKRSRRIPILRRKFNRSTYK